MDSVEQKLKALEAFKDWSNYLLVTTVAALGWVSTKDAAHFSQKSIRKWCIWLFASSVVFAILTLALIPHIGELINRDTVSIYAVEWDGWGPSVGLFNVCFPQHVLFLVAVILYAFGTSRSEQGSGG